MFVRFGIFFVPLHKIIYQNINSYETNQTNLKYAVGSTATADWSMGTVV